MRFDVPTIDNETEPWWSATREHRLLYKVCGSCDHRYWYPRDFCPQCWSEDTSWVQASGRATLYTYSMVQSNDLPPWNERVPYVAAVVDLDEGPRMNTFMLDVDESELTIGMALEVSFHDDDAEGFSLPVFRPA